jgi:DNA-binding NarL/FixJ family response regulator
MKPRILIVDDHEIVREGIRTLLARSGAEWEVCGEASNANDGIEATKRLKPDVVIMDITMPGLSGLEAARRISKHGLCTRVLMFTMHDAELLESEVRQAGAQGFVLKSQAARDLVLAIRTLLADGTFFGASPEPTPRAEEGPDQGAMHFESLGWVLALGFCNSFLK